MNLIRNRVIVYQTIILAALSFIILDLLILYQTPPAKGYEHDIYSAYPNIFWYLIYASIGLGSSVIIMEIMQKRPGRWWLAGAGVVIFSNFLIMLVPIDRGYYVLGRGDSIIHVGGILDVVNHGFFGSLYPHGLNPYPLIHMTMGTTSIFSGIEPAMFSFLTPVIFTLFFMVCVPIAVEAITQNIRYAMASFLFCTPMLFGLSFFMLAPSVQFLLFFPFVLYVIFETIKARSFANVLILLMIATSTPFFHNGDGTIMAVLFLLSIIVITYFFSIFQGWNNDIAPILARVKNISNVLLVMLIAWISWILNFEAFSWNVEQLWKNMIYGRIGTGGVTDVYVPNQKSIYGFIEGVGQIEFILMIIAVISFLYFINHWRKGHLHATASIILSFAIIMIGITVIAYVADISNWLTYRRFLKFTLIFSTIATGLLVVEFMNYNKIFRYGTALISFLIVITIVFTSVPTVFESPNINTVSGDVNRMECDGIQWLLSEKSDNYIDEIGISQARFSIGVFGGINEFDNVRYWSNNRPPDYFYTKNLNTYGANIPDDRYLICTTLSGINDPTSKTFMQLKYLNVIDNSAGRIYSNGNFWCYYINSTA